jgi:hypothetical protein
MEQVMAVNRVRVREKPVKQHRSRRTTLIVAAAFVVVLAVAGTLGYDDWTGKLGIVPQNYVVVPGESNGRIIRVAPGGNIQAALEQAASGDVVELQAGAVYNGEIRLPNKPLTDFVTIRSSEAAKLPVDRRVSPSQRPYFATIVAGLLGRPAVSASDGAHHYRFVGIEFTASTAMYNYGLITLGSGESRPDRLPNTIEIDRSYIHPHKTGVARRGIALNSASTTIKNSYIEGFGFKGEETQGICGWTGTRNVKILNNYIEGGAENIMFGGADPGSAELIPQDIEVRGNHLNKPAEWNEKVTLKTLFELKNAKRVLFAQNLLTNNWKGSAFRITVRNQDGGAVFSTIEEVVIRDNFISGAGEGINILGKDDTYPSQTLKRLTIENNIFTRMGIGGAFEGSGYFIQVAGGENITITRNTVLNLGNIATFYGETPRGFVFSNNIVGHGAYGIHGLGDLNSASVRSMFQNNVFVNLNRVAESDYAFPSGNRMVSDAKSAGIGNAAENDFRLTTQLAAAGVGSDVSKIPAEFFTQIPR